MPATKRKVKRFVIDVNSYVSIFIKNETTWLTRYIIQNKLEIFIDEQLIDELRRVLEYQKIKKYLPLDKEFYINYVRLISTHVTVKPLSIHCPDPDDDYLFVLALHAHAKILVTGEKVLLNWQDTPVEIITMTKFRELF
jgi:putative PIN family toxin of toxin-antitoxin system